MKSPRRPSFNLPSHLVLLLALVGSSALSAASSSTRIHLADFSISQVMSGSAKGNETWPFRMIRADGVHSLPNGQGEGVKICLLATGVDTSWPALEGVVIEGKNFVVGQDSRDLAEPHSYGSLLASVIAGQRQEHFVGVAPKAKIVVAKVFDGLGSTDVDTLIQGFDYCLQKSDVIYLGFGGSQNNVSMDSLFAQATLNGKTLIAAGGNGGASLCWPAKDKHVKAIGVVDQNMKVPSYSPKDSRLQFVAPGHQVPVWISQGKFKLVTGSGFSAAIVIGVEALRRSTGASSLRGYDLGLPTEQQGHGLIDAEATVLY